MSLCYRNNMICDYANVTYFENNLAWELPGIGRYAMYLGLEGIVYFLLTVLIEVGCDLCTFFFLEIELRKCISMKTIFKTQVNNMYTAIFLTNGLRVVYRSIMQCLPSCTQDGARNLSIFAS